jgi:hypothetical protein
MIWLHGYYQILPETKRYEIALSVIFLVGALVLTALKPPLRTETTQKETT